MIQNPKAVRNSTVTHVEYTRYKWDAIFSLPEWEKKINTQYWQVYGETDILGAPGFLYAMGIILVPLLSC